MTNEMYSTFICHTWNEVLIDTIPCYLHKGTPPSNASTPDASDKENYPATIAVVQSKTAQWDIY